MSRVFIWVNRNCPNCVRFSSSVLVYSVITTGVRKFYVAVVSKMIKISPFHDDIYWGTLLDLISTLRFGSPEAHHLFVNWLFALVSWRMNITRQSSLSFRTTSWILTMNCRSTLLTRSGQRWQRGRHLLSTFIAHLMKTLSVIAHSKADSERVFSMCRKIDDHSLATTLGRLFHAKSTWMSRAMHFSQIATCWDWQSRQHGTMWRTRSVIVMCRPLLMTRC